MEEEDWLDILRLIQAELRGIGLNSIAELSGYDEETFEGRREYGARKLAMLMLDALDRHLVIHSSETVEQSLAMIRQNVEGEGPSGAILFNNLDSIDVEGLEPEERLLGDQRIPSAIRDLKKLIEQLLETDGYGGAGGAGAE
jgi:hypothetical protein